MSITVDQDYVGSTTAISTSGTTAVNYVDVPLTTANSGTGYGFNSCFHLHMRDSSNASTRYKMSAVNSSGTDQTLQYAGYYCANGSISALAATMTSTVNITSFPPDDYQTTIRGAHFLIRTIPNTWAANNTPSVYVKVYYSWGIPVFQEWLFQPIYSETVGPPNVSALRFSVGGPTSGSTLYSLYPAQ